LKLNRLTAASPAGSILTTRTFNRQLQKRGAVCAGDIAFHDDVEAFVFENLVKIFDMA
jgi:hypothetical protein